MARIRATAAVLMVVLLVFPAATASAGTPDLEGEFAALVDMEREARGLGTLATMNDLVVGARAQAGAIADAGYLFHNTDLGSLTTGWRKLGENVGRGYSVESLHAAFMNSPGHRDNLLDPTYDHIGVGVVMVETQIYVAVVFADMVSVPTPEPLVTEPTGFEGSFYDDDGSAHESAIEAIAEAGLTNGCAGNRFCPDDPVTRGQMAAFLQRALDLPLVDGDHFSDDDGSPFETAIEALAASGLTSGCAANQFCPDDPVTRGQMAAFLARGLDLPPVDKDHFTDDDRSPFESSIDALASSGITKGCTASSFCPNRTVTRSQMASFLVRALGL